MSKRDEIKEKIKDLPRPNNTSVKYLIEAELDDLTDLMLKEKEQSFRAGYKAAGGDVSIVDRSSELSTHTSKTGEENET